MKARILILTVVGSLALAASPAYAGGNSRQLESVILSDGGSPASATGRAPTASSHGSKATHPAKVAHVTKPPWESPNHSQVARNSI
jgi:hypothetical protein